MNFTLKLIFGICMTIQRYIHSSKFILLLVSIFYVLSAAAQVKDHPKIGLTLSGGGAKGLAHIGILKAIDSAGLNIDYISGTSMGAVIGSLYAIGYSGNEIEQIARKMDWDKMLSNKITLRSLSIEEKEEYGKYAVEIPFQDKKLNLPTGALESEELWIKLSELYFPAYRIKNFSQFSIPFVSVATDISNAEPVVQDKGEIITAIRASMAIPGVFTAVEDNGHGLVDGGVIRNFPVTDVVAMGAEYTIGSNVAEGLLPIEKLSNPLMVLYQIASLREKKENKIQVSLTDMYIDQKLEKYTAGSFEKANEIIDSGIWKGKELYPQLKRLVDSLQLLHENGEIAIPSRLPRIEYVYISAFEIKGLKSITETAFLHSMNFENNASYTAQHLAEMIRRGYGTRDYDYIHYSLQPLDDGSAKIIFKVEESSPTHGKLAIHYNTFTGVSLIANATTRNYFSPNSKSLITMNLGENFRMKAEHLQYFGRGKHLELIPSIQYESLKVNDYNNFKKTGIYKLNYFITDLRLQLANHRNYTTGLGIRYEWERFTPSLQSDFEVTGRNHYLTGYSFFHFNSLNTPIYPDKGIKLYGELGWTSNQHPFYTYSSYGNKINPPINEMVNPSNYSRSLLYVEFYKPIDQKLHLIGLLQNGVNFGNESNNFNGFYVGGLNKMYRNQIVFAGLQDISMHTQSVSSALMGLRWNILSDFYLITRGNVLVNDFIKNNKMSSNPKWLTGASLTLAYKSLLGPIEISAMYSGSSKQVQAYVNFGFSF